MSAVQDADERVIVLPTGTLTVHVDEARWALDALCGFAARENPKRGFLVVSRVLGRHLPARPSVMRRSARELAALLPADLPGPVMVLGLAETAVCLGATVWEEYRAATGREDVGFLHSTRVVIDRPLLCRFEEPHSHASAHLVYRPDLPEPRSLVLVDDEVSTGTTLANLAGALIGCWPGVEAVAVATLTDWSGGGWLDAILRPARLVSLLSGGLEWTPGAAVAPSGAFDAAAGSLGRLERHRNFGRLGLREPIGDAPEPPLLPPGVALHVLGTGEFTYPPFRLAEAMERAGHDVVVQATSRSPARLGGSMGSVLRFADNYGTGVPNFLYNVGREDGRETWLCHETGAGSVDAALVEALGARVIGWT